MGDANLIRTLGDYSKPSHEGYRNTIELPVGKNVVPLRPDTIRLVQNGCSFHGLWSEDPNQHLKDFLKLLDSLDLDGKNRERTRLRLFQFSLHDQANNWLERLPAGTITTWENLSTRFLAHLFPPRRTTKLRNDILMRTIDQSGGGKLRDRNAEESWAFLEDLALYDNKSWNDPRDFTKPVKEISLPQDVMSTSDRRLIELENQVQRLINPHDDKLEEDPKNSNVAERKEEKRGTPQPELKDPTNIEKLGGSKNDKERETEWLDVEEPLDLVDTNKESVFESLIKEMPKCEDDYDTGCRKPSDLEDGFYRDTIKLGPKYLTRMDDEG
ncbi:MAK10-like protein [Tanacetum coccineum]